MLGLEKACGSVGLGTKASELQSHLNYLREGEHLAHENWKAFSKRVHRVFGDSYCALRFMFRFKFLIPGSGHSLMLLRSRATVCVHSAPILSSLAVTDRKGKQSGGE